MAESEEATLSEIVQDFKESDQANIKVPNDTVVTAIDEAVEVNEVGSEETDAKDESDQVEAETENIEVGSESQADEDVEDVLDVSKTTTELSIELNEGNNADDENKSDPKMCEDEATEVAEVGGNNGDDLDISEEEKQMIKDLFEYFDSDKTGKMSISELGNFMRAIDDEVGDLLVHMDDNESGMVDYSELLKHMASQIQIRKSIDPEHDFKEAFLIFDKDGNGRISREELTKILTEHGRMRVSLEEAEEYIGMVDQDNDGMLNYGEFVTLFTEKIGF